MSHCGRNQGLVIIYRRGVGGGGGGGGVWRNWGGGGHMLFRESVRVSVVSKRV